MLKHNLRPLAATQPGFDIVQTCHGVADAVAVLGNVTDIREMLIGFQKHLYGQPAVA